MRGRRVAPDRGSVTAEFAIALPAVVAVLVLAMVTTGALLAQIRCADAARAGARAAALGEDLAAVRAAVQAVADVSASVEVSRSGPWVDVRVERRVMSHFGPVVASARSTAWVEPGVAGGAGSDRGHASGEAGVRPVAAVGGTVGATVGGAVGATAGGGLESGGVSGGLLHSGVARGARSGTR